MESCEESRLHSPSVMALVHRPTRIQLNVALRVASQLHGLVGHVYIGRFELPLAQ